VHEQLDYVESQTYKRNKNATFKVLRYRRKPHFNKPAVNLANNQTPVCSPMMQARHANALYRVIQKKITQHENGDIYAAKEYFM